MTSTPKLPPLFLQILLIQCGKDKFPQGVCKKKGGSFPEFGIATTAR